MRINTEALKRAGWQIDFNAETGIIEIYNERGLRLDLSMVEEQLLHLQGLTPQDVCSLLDDFMDEIHSRQVWSSVRATQHEHPTRKKGKTA